MFERNNILIDINQLLTQIYQDMRKQAEIGFYDVNHKRERFFGGLLNLLLNLDLLIANQNQLNLPIVDLSDDTAGIAVVTTCKITPAKVKHIIQRFYEQSLNQRFNTLLFLSTEDSVNPQIDTTDSNTGTDIVFWGLNDIQKQLDTLHTSTLKNIRLYLREHIQSLSIRPTNLLQALPPPCDHFVPGSRNNELAKLRKLLKNRKPVFIWGLGGIGKTQTAIQLARQCSPPKGAYMIHCPIPQKNPPVKDATQSEQTFELLRATLLSADFGGYCFTGSDNARRDQEYLERLNILRTQYCGAMLVIDNLDWPTVTLQDICREPAYDDLASLDLQLVFTTRKEAGSDIGVKIDRLSDDHLLKLMHSIMNYTDSSDDELLKLIRAVNGHTLMVYLMAKIMDESWGDITPEHLLNALTNGTLQGILPTVSTDQNQSYKQQQIYGHLQSLFDIATLGELDRLVLQHAVLIPEGGIDQDLFLRCLPDRHRTVAESLILRGLMQDNHTLLTLHPVVREHFRHSLAPTDESCSKFLLRLQKLCDLSGDYQKDQLERIAGLFGNASDILPDQNGRWASFAGRLQDALGHPHEALKYNHRMLDRLENSISVDPKDMVTAYHQISNSYFVLGKYDEALRFQKIALERSQSLRPQDNLMLANSYTNIGNSYAEMERFSEALEYHTKALEIATDSNTPSLSPIDLAQFYTNVGLTHHSMHQDREALQSLLEALSKFEQALPSDHPDLARAYNHVGLSYDAINEHKKALQYKLNALTIFQKVLPPEHPELARAYNSIGKTYSALQQYEKALQHMTQALAIREKILPDGHPDLAVSYNNIALTYSSLEKFPEAYEYASKALELRRRYLPEHHPQLALSYRNLGLVCYAMNDYSQALHYLRQALDIFDYPENRGHPLHNNTHRLYQLIYEAFYSNRTDA